MIKGVNVQNKNGFSVVELLTVSSILLLLLGIITRGLISGGQVTQKIVVESDLLEDARAMGNMIADSITRAIYVYPPGATLELSTSDEPTTLNPNTGSSLWIVGNDPIIAFLERPENTSTSASCSDTQPEGCIFFNAYYPVTRSEVTKSSGPYPYLKDTFNDATWMLFEYRMRLDIAYADITSGSTPVPTGDLLAGEEGTIVAEYLIENSFNVSFDRCYNDLGYLNDSNNDNVPDCNVLDTKSIYASVVSGSFNFEQERKQRRSFKGTELAFAIAPRNLPNPAIIN